MSQAAKKSGVVSADRMYTTAALGRCGIGRNLVKQMRDDGVKPFKVGTDHWYDGSEVIAWLKTNKRMGRQVPAKS